MPNVIWNYVPFAGCRPKQMCMEQSTPCEGCEDQDCDPCNECGCHCEYIVIKRCSNDPWGLSACGNTDWNTYQEEEDTGPIFEDDDKDNTGGSNDTELSPGDGPSFSPG